MSLKRFLVCLYLQLRGLDLFRFLPLIRQYQEAKRVTAMTPQEWVSVDMEQLTKDVQYTERQRRALFAVLGIFCYAVAGLATIAGFSVAQLLSSWLATPIGPLVTTLSDHLFIGFVVAAIAAYLSVSWHPTIEASIRKAQTWLHAADEHRCADAVKLLHYADVTACRDQIVAKGRQITNGDLEMMQRLAQAAADAQSKIRSDEAAAKAREESRRLCRVMYGLERA